MSYLKFSKTELINLEYSLNREVLRTNRSGSYACTTIIDCNTRKYHGLLVCPLPELDGGRHVLLSTLDETIIQHEQEFNLALHKYAGDYYEPKGHKYIRDFTSDPIPKLLYRVGGVILSKERILVENDNCVLTRYTLVEANSPTILRLKPFLAFRNSHALSKANLDLNPKFNEIKNGISSNLYHGYPSLYMQVSKQNEFVPAPDWYYNIEYIKEQERGYEYKEDLYVPGYFEFQIKKGESIIFSAGLNEVSPSSLKQKFINELNKRIPRDTFSNCLSNTINQFFINSLGATKIIAGYPWLPMRSRDTLIALPGLTLVHDKPDLFKKAINQLINEQKGFLFKEVLEANGAENYPVDIPLWFIWSIQQLKITNPNENVSKLYEKYVKQIIDGILKEKNDFEVRENGLIYCNKNEHPNTWMNAEVNGKSIIKRYGYIVEINALWYNAIMMGIECATYSKNEKWASKLEKLATKIKSSFVETFWLDDEKYLADFVTDTEKNIQIRPNQLFATSLQYNPLNKEQCKSILDVVKNTLLVPFGIRSLAPTDANYQPKYEGNHEQREWAAFNGSVWPWLFTHYYEGLYKVYPKSALRAAERFTNAIKDEIQIDGLCSISELYHGDPPHKAVGAISFAKNTGELLRLKWMMENSD